MATLDSRSGTATCMPIHVHGGGGRGEDIRRTCTPPTRKWNSREDGRVGRVNRTFAWPTTRLPRRSSIMADTRSKYIPGSCLLSRRGGERGKMQVSIEQGTKCLSCKRVRKGVEREGGRKKQGAEETRWSRRIARSMFYLRRQRGGGVSRSKFSRFVEDAMFPTTLSIDFHRFSF